MRMWNVFPKWMCVQHLIGEYRELFTFAGSLRKKHHVAGYVKNNLIEPRSIRKRYDELVAEMKSRGYKPLKFFDYSDDLIDHLSDVEKEARIDVNKSLADLMSRCPKCKKRMENDCANS